jgi:capsular polysaccharide biosynthesis protein
MSVSMSPRPRGSSATGHRLRRLWVLPVTMVVVAAIAYLVAGVQSSTYSSQSTVVVSSAPGPVNANSGGAAGSLATTYAAALPHDQVLQAYVARTAHVSAGNAISVPPAAGALIKIRFTAGSSTQALAGARAIAAALTRRAPASAVVSPGTLTLVQGPSGTSLTPSGEHRAQVVLVVPPTGGPTEGINPDDADHLATTYAGVIPADDTLLADVGRLTGQSSSQVGQNLSVVNEQNTSILQISFKASTPAAAATGARAAARFVAGPNPVAAGIVPSSIAVVSLPQNPTAAAGTAAGAQHSSKAIVIGAALGLLLGLVLLVAWERSDPRISDTRELASQLGSPATPVDRLSPTAAHALVERWASLTDHVPARVAVLPADAGVAAQTEAAIAVLREGAGPLVHYVDARSGVLPEELDHSNGNGDARTGVTLVHAAPPGGESAGEAVALGCDLTVVAVPAGARTAEIRQLGEELTNFGIVPVWALLTSGGGRAARRAEAQMVDAAVH